MQYGFKFQKQEQQPEIEIAEQTTEPEDGKCICCGEYTTLVLEHDNGVKVFVPVCKKHLDIVRAKEKAIERMTEAIKEIILA